MLLLLSAAGLVAIATDVVFIDCCCYFRCRCCFIVVPGIVLVVAVAVIGAGSCGRVGAVAAVFAAVFIISGAVVIEVLIRWSGPCCKSCLSCCCCCCSCQGGK